MPTDLTQLEALTRAPDCNPAIEAFAPTEPRARTAAALRVLAAMMEDGE